MRFSPNRFLIILVLLLPCFLGCGIVAEALFNGLIDSAFESQYYDGAATTKRERQARFEEGHIRFMKRPDSYGHDGTVPSVD